MITDYFFVYSYFFQFWTMKFQIIKNFWDMEIIGNRRKKKVNSSLLTRKASYHLGNSW